jgi:hypothetical protein
MDNLSIRSFTGTLVKVTFAKTAGSVNTIATTGIITPIQEGKYKTTLAAQADVAPPGTDYVTGIAPPAIPGGASVANVPGSGAIVIFGLVAGAIKMIQGPISRLDMQGNFRWDGPYFPVYIPIEFVPFGYIVAKAGATASATAIVVGTANWDATGFTQSFGDLAQLPSRSMVS